MEKIGIDVHKVATQICILTGTGEYEECRIRTERDALTTFFGERPKARILLEAATESEWVARHLEALGHEVIVADPNFAPMYPSAVRCLSLGRVSSFASSDRREPDASQALERTPGARADAHTTHLALPCRVAPGGHPSAWRRHDELSKTCSAAADERGARVGSGSPADVSRTAM